MTDTIEINRFPVNGVVVYGFTMDGDTHPEYCNSYDVVDEEIYEQTSAKQDVSGIVESFTAGQLKQALVFAAGYNARKRMEKKI